MTARTVRTPSPCGPVSSMGLDEVAQNARVLDVPLFVHRGGDGRVVRCPAATAPCTWSSSPRTTGIRPTARRPAVRASTPALCASGARTPGRWHPRFPRRGGPRSRGSTGTRRWTPPRRRSSTRDSTGAPADRWTRQPGVAGWRRRWPSRWRCVPRQARTTSWRCDSTDTRGNRSGSPRTVTSCSPPAGWWAAAPRWRLPSTTTCCIDAD